ncbi:MAG: cob(I)yrinic acid a,c-diamide adenosyltransferase [Dehalococcoidales bacterium]|nr:cob(I)yrinic acid a,c-diamide adenosyltransferase [Dehalococcoidales bacterium]
MKRKERLVRGYIQVYTGEGKGKTTAALGLALRAAGQGLSVAFIQFLKGETSGEQLLAAGCHLFEFIRLNQGICLRQSNEELRPVTEQTLSLAEEKLAKAKYDIIVLDEIFTAVNRGLITTARVIDLLDKKPDNVELVLTGRKAPREVIERADLVTNMTAVKHYFRQGTKGRKGIEY